MRRAAQLRNLASGAALRAVVPTRLQDNKPSFTKSNELKTKQIESTSKPFFHWFAVQISATIAGSSDARIVFDNRIAG